MGDTITLKGGNLRTVLAAHPVTRESYKQYLRDTGQAVPHALAQPESPLHPVTHVSQVEALAYCRWLGGRHDRACRLPAMWELQELADELPVDETPDDVWPHTHGDRAELRGGLKPVFLCEWTMETDTIEQPAGRPPRILGSIFYPPWLRQGSHLGHAQAYLSATEGYSFVTFRVAFDEGEARAHRAEELP